MENRSARTGRGCGMAPPLAPRPPGDFGAFKNWLYMGSTGGRKNAGERVCQDGHSWCGAPVGAAAGDGLPAPCS